ncbi:hypothetical protein BDA96_10G281500 [Sorghum bicolor]|uniref:Uncharacterized protein n=2 Tax=Sorghum bicolor TaxID=4558 RepID=A0A921U2A5_SORBI|nr:hypothetical protein BDA96_10G281500 [Sorghum bicolor]OQU76815.1 hypothetical protein SORBI_3010G216901 [Sorghum bicolor]
MTSLSVPVHPPIAPIPVSPPPLPLPRAEARPTTRSPTTTAPRGSRRCAYAMAVRACLCRLGECEMERHDRLRALMVRLEADGHVDRLLRAQGDDHAARTGKEEQIQYPFFTKGTQELLKARVDIAQYSLPRAKARIEMAKHCHEDFDEDLEAEAELVVKQAGEFVLECSEIGDDRPLIGCSFSCDASMLATRYFLLIIRNYICLFMYVSNK